MVIRGPAEDSVANSAESEGKRAVQDEFRQVGIALEATLGILVCTSNGKAIED